MYVGAALQDTRDTAIRLTLQYTSATSATAALWKPANRAASQFSHPQLHYTIGALKINSLHSDHIYVTSLHLSSSTLAKPDLCSRLVIRDPFQARAHGLKHCILQLAKDSILFRCFSTIAAGVVTVRPVRIIGKVRDFPMKSSRILGQSHFQRLMLLGCVIIMLCHRRRP